MTLYTGKMSRCILSPLLVSPGSPIPRRRSSASSCTNTHMNKVGGHLRPVRAVRGSHGELQRPKDGYRLTKRNLLYGETRYVRLHRPDPTATRQNPDRVSPGYGFSLFRGRCFLFTPVRWKRLPDGTRSMGRVTV